MRSISRALTAAVPQIDLVFDAGTGGADTTVEVGVTLSGSTLVLQKRPGQSATGRSDEDLVPRSLPIEGTTPGALVAAWLLLHWPDRESAVAADALLQAAGCRDAPLTEVLRVQARLRLASPAQARSGDLVRQLRALQNHPTSTLTAADRLVLRELLAESLIGPPSEAAHAVRAYEALDIAEMVLTAHWTGGDIEAAASGQHRIARIRLALGRCEHEAMHLIAARSAIASALAHAGRAGDARLHAADLELSAEIEQALSEHRAGTACLIRAVTSGRQAVALTAPDDPLREQRLVRLATALIELGERESDAERLDEAVALARTAVAQRSSSESRQLLGRALLAKGVSCARGDLIEECKSLVDVEAEPKARRLLASAYEASGRLRSDAEELRKALALWESLSAQGATAQHADVLRQRSRCALLAARLTADPLLHDQAIALARALNGSPESQGITGAMDAALLGRALLGRAEAHRRGRANAREAEHWLTVALTRLARESLPRTKAKLVRERQRARRLVSILDGRADEVVTASAEARIDEILSGEAVDTSTRIEFQSVAQLLDSDTPSGDAERLAEARRSVIAILDSLTTALSSADEPIALDWLHRIERAQQR
ncbi:MAG: hypothetical protein R3D57_08665 [Hyphomicrobiaceae bacterium]